MAKRMAKERVDAPVVGRRRRTVLARAAVGVAAGGALILLWGGGAEASTSSGPITGLLGGVTETLQPLTGPVTEPLDPILAPVTRTADDLVGTVVAPLGGTTAPKVPTPTPTPTPTTPAPAPAPSLPTDPAPIVDPLLPDAPDPTMPTPPDAPTVTGDGATDGQGAVDPTDPTVGSDGASATDDLSAASEGFGTVAPGPDGARAAASGHLDLGGADQLASDQLAQGTGTVESASGGTAGERAHGRGDRTGDDLPATSTFSRCGASSGSTSTPHVPVAPIAFRDLLEAAPATTAVDLPSRRYVGPARPEPDVAPD